MVANLHTSSVFFCGEHSSVAKNNLLCLEKICDVDKIVSTNEKPWWLDSLAWQLGHLVAHGHVLFGSLVACVVADSERAITAEGAALTTNNY